MLPFDEAKTRARKIIADIDEGRNPNKEKEAKRLSPTLAGRALRDYLRPLRDFRARPLTKRDSTLAEIDLGDRDRLYERLEGRD